VIGREAASLPRFQYSEALSNSGLVWTEENLRKWIADNDGLVPGTRMRHVSITDPAEQDYLIAFLRTLTP
jgi:cytochrome c